MSIFYGRNQFVFPYGSYESSELHALHRMPEVMCWMPYLRDVSYSFDMREEAINPYDLRQGLIYNDPRAHGVGQSQAAAQKRIHDYSVNFLEGSWETTLGNLRAMTKLRRLQIDLEECYCPLSCCRKVEYICDGLRLTWDIGPPETIEILGCENDAEKAMVKQKLRTLNGVTNDGKIKFVGLLGVQKTDLYDLSRALT
jgi:hypothetical protein